VAHPWLKGREAQNVLMELDACLSGYDSSEPWTIDPYRWVHELLSFGRLRQEVHEFCGEAGVEEHWTDLVPLN
jgi:hypothetical protein